MLTGGRLVRVLHVHPGNIYGGVETMLLTQAQHRNDVPGMQASFALCFVGRFSEQLDSVAAPVHWLGKVRVRQPLSIRRVRHNLGELLRREPFDVVVTHSCWSQAIFGPVVRKSAVPLVFYLHGPAKGRHWLERWARRTPPDKVVCNSRFTASTLHHLYPQVPAKVVYCPVAPPQLSDADSDRKQTRAELQTPEGATVIIQVSRMEPWKGHRLHLEALSLLKDLPDWVCWQVGGAQTPGEENYERELKETASRLGIAERVRFLGQRTEVARLLFASDIFCQPNTGPEPFGISFIEALYAHLPVVTTNLGGAPEIVDDSCGLLVQPNDATALANTLKLLLENRDLRQKLGKAGFSRATALCDVSSQMGKLQKYFSE
jgi:glycosyltransferase involved in cell wall biosynthesis